MGATGCLDGNVTLAEGALFGGGSCGSGLLFANIQQSVDALQNQEQNEGGQNEVQDRGNKCGCAGGEGLGPGLPFPGENGVQKGLDKVCGQGGYDGGKGAADDDTDCHIQHVSAQGKFFKFS